MALIVEDGTGITDADSYISVTDATTYHEEMGNTSWLNRPDLHELALRNATSVTDMRYGGNYRGILATSTQSLLFPRTSFYDKFGRKVEAYTIPTILKNSVAELALVYINNEQTLIENTSKEDALSSESVDIGGAVVESKSYFYAVKDSKTTKSDLIIAPLLNSTAKNLTAVRG